MKTVIALAETLSKAAFSPIERLDIHYVREDNEEAYYSARLWLADNQGEFFDIYESGEIKKGWWGVL